MRICKEAIENWIIRGKYINILDLWAKGLNFDWNRFYGKEANEDKPAGISVREGKVLDRTRRKREE